MQATVAVLGILRFPPEQLAEVLPHLRTLVEATRRTAHRAVARCGPSLWSSGTALHGVRYLRRSTGVIVSGTPRAPEGTWIAVMSSSS